jgi:ubiquinone/menaquinone biosynthesis C-methylase UbiE
MADVLNYGALNLSMGIGYRLGLFDAMERLSGPKAAGEIAEEAGLDPRYVTEWLGVMVCGGVVGIFPETGGENRFFLPEEHADLLTRRAGEANLGVYTQEIPLLTACALEPVAEGFATGSGVSYEHYPKFQRFMTELADAKHRRVLVDSFLPSVDGGKIIRQLESGIRVCDLGCGEGVAALLMAEAFPKSEFVGIELSADALAAAESTAHRQGAKNVRFIRADAARLDQEPDLVSSFGYVTAFDAIHDQSRPEEALASAYAILRPGGAFSMVDIAASSNMADNRNHPMGPFLYTVSLMHCMPIGRVNGGAGLGMMWGRQKAEEMLKQAGFSSVSVEKIPDDPFNLHFFCRKPV